MYPIIITVRGKFGILRWIGATATKKLFLRCLFPPPTLSSPLVKLVSRRVPLEEEGVSSRARLSLRTRAPKAG